MSENQRKRITKQSLYRFARKWTIRSFLFLVGLTALAALSVVIFQESIKDYIIAEINEDIQGTVTLEDVSFSTFSNFPHASLELGDFQLFEPSDPELDSSSNTLPILQVENMIVSFDMLALIRGSIIVNWMAIEGGEARLVFDEAGGVNFEKAFAERPTEQTAYLKAQAADLEIHLEELNVSELSIRYEDAISQVNGELQIDEFTTGLSYDAHDIFADPSLDLELTKINFLNGPSVEDIGLQLDGDLKFDRTSNTLSAEHAMLEIEEALFEVDGTLDLDDLEVNATFEVRNEQLELLANFIEKDVLDYSETALKDGRIALSGSIVGKLRGEVPEIKGLLEVSDLILRDPISQLYIKANRIHGTFNAGTAPDLSDFSTEIDDLDINIFDGYVKGSASLKNLQHPEIEVKLDSRFDLAVIDDFFELEEIDSLEGEIEVAGRWNSAAVDPNNSLIVKIHDASGGYAALNYPVTGLNATVSLDEQQLVVDSISVKLGPSDLKGKIRLNDFLQLIENTHGNVVTQLDLRSTFLNLNDIIADTIVNNRAISTIADIELQLELGLYYEKSAFYSYPRTITWNLERLDSQLPFPDSYVKGQSVGSITQSDSLFALESANTSVATSLGSVDISKFAYRELNHRIDNIGGTLSSTNLAFDSILYYVFDTLEFEIMKNRVTTDLQFDLMTKYQTWDASISGNVEYMDPALDTIAVRDIELAGKLEWGTRKDSVRVPVSYEGSLLLGTIESSLYSEKNLSLNSSWSDSTFLLSANSDRRLATYDDLRLKVTNPIHNPYMELDYALSGLDLAKLMKTDEDESVMSGTVSFTSHLNSSGRTNEQIFNNLSGHLDVYSDGIIIHGVNLDEVLENYGKSQKFRLTDLGAFFLAGPFGAVVTKGYDFSRIAKINPLDSTKITAFKALWSLDSGNLIAEDVAFVTPQNLVALKGRVDLEEVYIDTATVAVIDKKGCPLIDQSVKGTFDSLQFSDFKVGGTLFGAVINVYKVVVNKKCETFYEGSLTHPEAK